MLYSSGAYRGHCGKALDDSQVTRVSAGQTIQVRCSVGAAVAFGGNALR